jgi:hypothetical protein
MINEILPKFVCHNICCLIHALFELGVESKFGNKEGATPVPAAVEIDPIEAMAWL